MSIFVILRAPGDPDTFERYTNDNADMVLKIAQAGKDAGAIRHAFGGGEGEIVVLDEWPDEGAFQKFFDSQPEIATLMRNGGVTGAPAFTFYRKLDTPDEF